MQLLKERILKDGVVKPGNVLKVDSFLNHQMDIDLIDLPIYDTHYEAYGFINYQEEFEQGKTDYVMFTSASTVRGFAQAAKGLDFSKVQALCIGKQTKAVADHYGMQTFMAEQPTLEAMVALVKERKRTW